VRQVRVQGCLPTLLFLAILAGLLALAVSFGLAIGLVSAGLVLLAGLVKAVRALLRGSGGPEGARPGRPAVEVLPPGWAEQQPGGPVVEAGGPGAGATGAGAAEDQPPPTGDDERNGPPRG